jgi:RimJ/RimL family protein N-acetyltransferase
VASLPRIVIVRLVNSSRKSRELRRGERCIDSDGIAGQHCDVPDQLTARRLESERVLLEPLRPEHAEELAPVLDDVALHRFIGGAPLDAAELRVRSTRQALGISPDGRERWLNWVVRERAAGAAVGTMQATITPAEQVGELAWVIGRAHQGHGYAKESAALVASWLRARGVLHLRAHVHPEHRASAAVARAIGLSPTEVVQEGEVRWESTRHEP